MKIGFVGPFDSFNFGDYAMLINNIYTLGQHEYTLFVSNEGIMKAVQERYLQLFDISCKLLLVTDLTPPYGVYDNMNDSYAYTPPEIISKLNNKEEILRQLEKLQVLIVNGGGYFNHPWNKKYRKNYLFAMMATILLANELKIKIVFTGNTFGPFGDNAPLFSNFFGVLQNVVYACRDDIYSPLELRKIGIEKEISIIPDDLYFLDNKLSNHTYNPKVNIPNRFVLLEMNDKLSTIEENYSFINLFVKTLREKYGLYTVILPCHDGWGGENQCSAIAEIVPEACYIPFSREAPKFREIEEVRFIAQKADLIICHKYHLFVFGIANNIPSIFGMRDVYGDKVFCYTKSAGVLKMMFSNQLYRESDFIDIDIWNSMHRVMNNADGIITNQRELFNAQKVENETHWLNVRRQFLKRTIS